MEKLNEIIEGLMIDVTSEGMGTTMGFLLMWGLFFGGTFTVFHSVMNLLSSTI